MTNSRKVCREGQRCEPASLAESIACAVFHSDLPAKEIAARIGVDYHYLRDAASVTRSDTQFQARLLVPLMQITGNVAPLRFMGFELGAAVIRLPEANGCLTDASERLFRVVGELGDVSNEHRAAVSDSTVEEIELRRIAAQGEELMQATAGYLASINSLRFKREPARMDLAADQSTRRMA